MEDPHQINHTQFKAFHAVASAGGFTAAAKILGLTQPALTHHIRELEKKYRAELFLRNGRSVHLTPIGAELLTLSKRYFKIAEEAHIQLRSLETLQSGRLRICTDLAARAFPLTAEFRSKHKAVQLDLTPTQTAEEALLDYLMDIALTGRPLLQPQIESIAVTTERLHISAPHTHPLAGHSELLLPELAGHDLYLLTGNAEEEVIQKKLLGKLNIKPTRLHYFTCRELLKESAHHEGGVLTLPPREMAHDQRFISIPLLEASLKRQEFVSCLKQRRNLPVIKAFMETAIPDPLTG